MHPHSSNAPQPSGQIDVAIIVLEAEESIEICDNFRAIQRSGNHVNKPMAYTRTNSALDNHSGRRSLTSSNLDFMWHLILILPRGIPKRFTRELLARAPLRFSDGARPGRERRIALGHTR